MRQCCVFVSYYGCGCQVLPWLQRKAVEIQDENLKFKCEWTELCAFVPSTTCLICKEK